MFLCVFFSVCVYLPGINLYRKLCMLWVGFWLNKISDGELLRFWRDANAHDHYFVIHLLLPKPKLLPPPLLMPLLLLDDNSISLYCHVVINSVINVTPTHTIFKKRLNDLRWYSDPDDDDDDDVMADAEYSPIFGWKNESDFIIKEAKHFQVELLNYIYVYIVELLGWLRLKLNAKWEFVKAWNIEWQCFFGYKGGMLLTLIFCNGTFNDRIKFQPATFNPNRSNPSENSGSVSTPLNALHIQNVNSMHNFKWPLFKKQLIIPVSS